MTLLSQLAFFTLLTLHQSPANDGPPAHVPTVDEFVATFAATPGRHDVVILHPYTQKPVKVRFWLPPDVDSVVGSKRRIIFSSPRWNVAIWFRPLGAMEVDKYYGTGAAY
jgi:hypothetical protein